MADSTDISHQGHRRDRKHKHIAVGGVPSGMSPIPNKESGTASEIIVRKIKGQGSRLEIGTREYFNYFAFEDLVRAMDKEPPANALAEVIGYYDKRRTEELRKNRSQVLTEYPQVFPITQTDKSDCLIAVRSHQSTGDRWQSVKVYEFLTGMLLERLRIVHPMQKVRFVMLEGKEYDRIVALSNPDQRAIALGQQPAEKTALERFFAIVGYAIARGASDIHLEPRRGGHYRVRFRIDGVLEQHKFFVAADIAKELVNVFKIKAKPINVAEKRLGQDGAINFTEQDFTDDNGEVDVDKFKTYLGYNMRVSTMPSMLGEKVNARLLKETSTEEFALDKLNLPPEVYHNLIQQLAAPHGLIVVTGPTGSGKTTTLYSCLQELNAPDVNISTVEDPVEVIFEDFNQQSVNEKIQLTFARCLRGLMRQDPDIILVGEIRDEETALVAVQAAFTGHLVFSTLHTNDASGSIPRLEDLGLTRPKILEAVKMIMAQRLVRKLNPSSSEPYDAREEINALFGREVITFPVTLYRPQPGLAKETEGYGGRGVVVEMLVIDDEIRALGYKPDASLKDITQVAIKNGMRPLVISGLEMALRGETSLAELQRNVFTVNEFRQWEDLIKKLLVEAKATDRTQGRLVANE